MVPKFWTKDEIEAMPHHIMVEALLTANEEIKILQSQAVNFKMEHMKDPWPVKRLGEHFTTTEIIIIKDEPGVRLEVDRNLDYEKP